MFGNFKKKLSSVIQEASDNIQQYRQRVSTPSSPGSTPSFGSSLTGEGMLEMGIAPDLNMAAGCNLLAKYEDDWKAIHSGNEENAQTAEKLAQQIEQIARRTKQQQVTMAELVSGLHQVPRLVEQLQASMVALEAINAYTAKVEEEFDKLQELCQECDLQEFMMQQRCELGKYKQNKMQKLEDFRQKVAAEHQEKIRRHEERLREIQQERQAVFDSEFQEDLQQYKQTGTLNKIQKDITKDLSLEQVVLEDTDTKDALEEFLNG